MIAPAPTWDKLGVKPLILGNDQIEMRIREVIASWRSVTELASFALRHHGYGNSDGGFGVIYPGDLDEYEKEVERKLIPEGSVELYGYWGPPEGYEFTISEAYYLQVLATVLREAGFSKEADDIDRQANHCA